MTLEVGKASHSGEEALGLKKYMTKALSDQEKLREVIVRNREKEEFLMAHRWVGWDKFNRKALQQKCMHTMAMTPIRCYLCLCRAATVSDSEIFFWLRHSSRE